MARVKLTPTQTAQAEIRKLVTALHQEIWNLKNREGERGEAALEFLREEYARIMRQGIEAGMEYEAWNGTCLDHAQTAEAVVYMMK